MMKVFANNVIDDLAVSRVAAAVKRHAPPEVKLVNSEEEADLVLLYCFGRRRHFKWHIESLTKLGKKYAMLQLALRTTMNPNTIDWLPIWKGAEVVWSYYNLPALCKEDGVSPDFNFYHSPMGVDDVFFETPTERKYIIASSGHGYLTESARECILAAANIGRPSFHVGPMITGRPNVDFANGMDDTELAKKYSECEFVSGLRRCEGFELPVIEGLMCGARPIVFDKPHYRMWFNGLAEFIPETSRETIIEDITKLFKKGARPVSEAEIEETRRRFDWKKIVEGFWKYL